MARTPSYYALQEILESETRTIEYLQDKKVLPQQMKCPTCDQDMTLNHTLFSCGKRTCRKSVSIFKDTIFSESKIPYNKLLTIAYLWIIGCKHQSILAFTGMSPTTITRWLKLFKELVSFNLEEKHQQIGGKDIIVE